jgi:hypothetical protein
MWTSQKETVEVFKEKKQRLMRAVKRLLGKRDHCGKFHTEHSNGFCIIKPTRCINFSILFWNENLRVLDSSSVHHQEYFTVHTAMVYIVPVCKQLASRIRMELSSILIGTEFHPDRN